MSIPKPKTPLLTRLRNKFNNPSRSTTILGCGFFIFSFGCCLFSLYLALLSSRPPSTETSSASQAEVATDVPPSTPTTAPAPTDTPLPTSTPVPAPTDAPPPTSTPVPAPTDAPPPTSTPVSAPTDAPQPTSTPIPSPTYTPQPTSTPTPSPTDTPTPTSSPTETEPPQGSTILIIEVNKSAEYVEIVNVGSEPQDLTGWELLSEKGGQRCTLGGILDPEQTLRIWALAEDAAEGGYNCEFGSNIWHNSEEDLAILFDVTGQEIDRK